MGDRVGYPLYREIKNHAPDDWTAGERLVALIIADDANDKTRRSKMPIYELMEQTGYSNRMICKCLDKLRERGFEFRVIHGTRKDGSPVYTCKGRAVSYQVPHIPKDGTRVPPLPIPVPVDNPVNGGTPVPPSRAIGGTPVPPGDSNGGTRVNDWRHSGAAPYPQPSSTPGVPVVRGAVEVQRGALSQEQRHGVEVEEQLAAIRRRGMHPIEYEAWQAAESRQRSPEPSPKENDRELPHHVRQHRPVRDPG